MNRNVESRFAQLPSVEIQRSIFKRNNKHITTFNVGDLIPLYWDEVLPGDTWSVQTNKLVRLQTLLTPIMDNLYMDIYWLFVPNRLTWEHWRQFCGENTSSAWVASPSYTIPKIKAPSGGFASGTIADYLGIPVGVQYPDDDPRAPMALPFRAYALICNEFFRDENLTDPLNIPVGDSNQTGTNGSSYINDVANGGMPFKVAKYHDRFTSALPAPQKGDASLVPVVFPDAADIIPVETFDQYLLSGYPVSKYATVFGLRNSSDTPPTNYYSEVSPYTNGFLTVGSSPSQTFPEHVSKVVTAGIVPTNLGVKLGGSAIAVNELRLAFQYQKMLEKNARGGTRYIELLKAHFGVTSPDARLQRPEYLGGNRIPLQINQVTNTAQTNSDFLGDTGAMSVTSDSHYDFEKSFTEHGILMCVGCVRYDHTYSQGLAPKWSRTKFTDFYLPVFANIGESPIYGSEIYLSSDKDDNNTVFGYQEAWSEYRYAENLCSGEMRPGISGSLASWHLGDYYQTAPTLSDAWIREDKTNVDRVLAVSSAVSNQCLADFWFNATVTRPMPMYSIPGLVDHH